jgi:hypothetical protein
LPLHTNHQFPLHDCDSKVLSPLPHPLTLCILLFHYYLFRILIKYSSHIIAFASNPTPNSCSCLPYTVFLFVLWTFLSTTKLCYVAMHS